MAIMTSHKQTGLIRHFFLGLPLRKTFLATSGIAILLLIGVSVLGLKQYLLYQHCEQVVTSSKHLLFQFSAIKEHINEALITRKNLQFKDISTEIEALGTDIEHIVKDVLIPENLKQGFITQIDLVGLVVKLRTVQETTDAAASTEQLYTVTTLLRSIDSRITQFHQGLSTYTQGLLLGLHKTLVGCLALFLSVISALLFWINKSLSGPILQLGQKIRGIPRHNEKSDDQQTKRDKGLDVSIHEIVEAVTTLSFEHLRLSQLFSAIALYETFSQKSRTKGEALATEQWHDLCSVLQTNGDYCLVWVGTISESEELPQPISACGCLAATEEGCLEILDHLLKYCKKDGGLCDSVNRAMQTKTAMISRLLTSSLPDSLRNLLPFPDNTFSSATFPISGGERLIAFITLYSAGHDCFQASETTLLAYLFNHLILLGHEQPGDAHDSQSAPVKILPLEAMSRIYRYAAIGNLTTGLTHELTNLSNGAINYTQALLDMNEERPQNEESHILLNNLLTEEKKISRLAIELQQLARENSEDTRPCSIQEIIQPIETIIKGQAKAEGIELLINIASGLPPIPKNGQDIQMVILSLIQNARSRVVEKYPSGKHERKKIQITAMLDKQADQCRILVTIQDQGVTWPSSQSDQNNVGLTPEPWLALHQCKLFLQKIGGDLTIETIPEQHNICTCILPC